MWSVKEFKMGPSYIKIKSASNGTKSLERSKAAINASKWGSIVNDEINLVPKLNALNLCHRAGRTANRI